MNTAHEFALYVDRLAQQIVHEHVGQIVSIADRDLSHRMTRVLRLKAGQKCILFDHAVRVHVQVISSSDRSIEVQVKERAATVVFAPAVTVLLPVLKKDACESAVSNATALGATTIQFVTTQKCHAQKFSHHEWERLTKIMRTSCEQSKNFAGTEMRQPIDLERALATLSVDTMRICASSAGQSFAVVANQENRGRPIVLLAGPEGGLTEKELQLAREHTFIFVALTPTVLESWLAVTLLVGMCRAKQ